MDVWCDIEGCLGVASVEEVVKRGRLRWYGHVERKDKGYVERSGKEWVACQELQVDGTKNMWRGRKTWNELVKVDKKRLGLVDKKRPPRLAA